mmetsp:Transcript_15539/g.30512  ORF Transcript_15539/g.30512 Transcript_15539/m.30512 type:complete len:293 (+) Transcript_15539:45-923(+)
MADRLSRIIGTEEDKVNCPFYFKIGACRHGDRCSRNHLRPTFSQTLMIPHLYIPPPSDAQGNPTADPEDHFEEFYEEILEELSKFGEVEQFHTVENLGDHMFGNVYIKYRDETDAESCLKAMSGRYYAGRMLTPEYSPVTDFSEARCRQFDEGECKRGGFCNFMHLRHVSRHLRKLIREFSRKNRKSRRRSRSRSRDRDRGKDRDRDRRRRSRSRSRSGGKKEDLARSGSAERRAKIAEWNKAREAPPAATDAPASNGEPATNAEPTTTAPVAAAEPAAEAPVADQQPTPSE